MSLVAYSLAIASKCSGQNFAVTAGDTINYTINGQPDPSFTLQRGITYVFQINNLFIHPFYIKFASGFGSAGAFNNGVANNGATSGNITFTVPGDAPDNLLYQCGNHPSMLGALNIITPATPPTVRIVYINVGDFITVKSTGTNGWSASPEFKCDASTLTWTPVGGFTNSFNGGTNTTTFPRLDPICGSTNVLVRIRNQSN